MSIWNRIMGLKSGAVTDALSGKFDSSRYVFVDVEVGMHDHKIHDIGALRYDEAVYHSASKKELFQFINEVDYICGHKFSTQHFCAVRR